ncbi:MAG: hypothetical protein K2N44_12975 [Lachnospiraceae bacterium]|nr:hypothetical protein [Lachnospiraceae bacterium]
MNAEFINILRSGFFDYAVTLSEIRTPGETTAAVKVLNAVLELIESASSSDIVFVCAVVEDMRTMIGIAQKEAEQEERVRKAVK